MSAAVTRWTLPVTFTLAALFLPASAESQQISSEVLSTLAANGQASYLVVLRSRANLAGVDTITDRTERGWRVYEALKDNADRSQKNLIALVAAGKAAGRVREFRSFFSVNAIGVVSDES